MNSSIAPSAEGIGELASTSKQPIRKGKQKSKHIKLLMHPPSIPTAFQTFHYDESEQKAFNSTTPRFNIKPHELPGPGYYSKFGKIEASQLDDKGSSKGFGIGFTSVKKRFDKLPEEPEISNKISPAEYNANHLPQYHRVSGPTAAFKPFVAKTLNNESRISYVGSLTHHSKTPGPGQYNSAIAMSKVLKSHAEESGASFVFRSRTVREAGMSDSLRHIPPPGAYDSVELVKPSGAVAAFKATERSVHSIIHNTPGPAAYNPFTHSNDKQQTTQQRSLIKRPGPFISVAQQVFTNTDGDIRPASHYMGVLQSDKVSSSSRPYSAASSSMGTVLTSLSDKMKKHWQSRPAGTAHHSYLAPKGGPGPGRYNLAAAADKVHTRSIVPRSMFLSTTPRFSEPTREQNKLGPGFYQPIRDVKMRSFILNLENVWV